MKSQSMYLKLTLCLLILLSLGLTSVAHAHSLRPQGGSPAFSHTSDVGHVAHKGAVIATGDTYRLWGSGSDIWGWHDQFHYAWSHLSGDGQVVAHIQSQDGSDAWAKAGIMLRGSLADNAANVFLALTPAHGVTFQWRTINQTRTQAWPGPQGQTSSWLKLVRHNQTVTGYASPDGTTWTQVSSATLSLPTASLIGLAVTAHNNHTRSRTVFTHVQLILGTPIGPPAYTATSVYGQPDFTTGTANTGGISAISLHVPWAVLTDSSGGLYVADDSNNRVLYYPAGSITATRVYGQSNFTTGTANTGGISATSLSGPEAMALDTSGGLYVADDGNNRVLYYQADSTTATRVYGQPDFTTGTSNTGGISATSIYGPAGLALDNSGNLYVADYSNNRVLYYPAGTATATRVYGQANFTTGTANTGGLSDSSLSGPMGLALDASGGLYIADDSNNRVLYYPAGSATATRVYGQPDFITGTANTGGVSATSLNDAEVVALDASGNLYVGDSNNNRVLYYPAGSTTATRVYGQPGFTTNTTNYGGISASSISYPQGVTLDSSGNLYVADYGNNRVLMFPHT